MPVKSPATLNKGRAILTFALAYIAVTILGIALSLSISAVGHIPQTANRCKTRPTCSLRDFCP